MATIRKKTPAVKKARPLRPKARTNGKTLPADFQESYNKFKNYKGSQYTGMKIGRSHKWYYDQGEWKETKITPDLWEISYTVTKRRAGRAPEGSGVPEGTSYHWYILAHQNVKKLNANDYSTSMSGFKYKLAHHRADKQKWSTTAQTQRKRLIRLLEDTIAQLKQELIQFEFDFNGTTLKGEATPVKEACFNGMCMEFEIVINDEFMGIIKYRKSGWKMDGAHDAKLVRAIGKELSVWQEGFKF